MAYRTTYPFEGSQARNALNTVYGGYLGGTPSQKASAARALGNIGMANVAGRTQADTQKLAWEKFYAQQQAQEDAIKASLFARGAGTGRYVDVPEGAETMEVGGETLVGEGPGRWRSMVNDPGREAYLRKYGFTRDMPIRGSGFSTRSGIGSKEPIRRTNVMGGLGQPVRTTSRLRAPAQPDRRNVRAREYQSALNQSNWYGDRGPMAQWEMQYKGELSESTNRLAQDYAMALEDQEAGVTASKSSGNIVWPMYGPVSTSRGVSWE